ncbi:hypothetical protein DY000_02059865 [Brassica cretica]|uniref:Uncharacterized protein n=1 Tax=Brassica cretica TaxID=69181 RepID=A0ABQ7AS36_BRACR|nr:hypothetical protein DY000_02059865 [Brassica cretica]
MDLSISALTSKIEAMQGELVEIQRYIARRPEAYASIDGRNNISTDIGLQTSVDDATNRGRLVPKVPKLTSNTKPDIIAYLGAWCTWDRILQTSLEGLGGGNLQGSLHKEFLDIVPDTCLKSLHDVIDTPKILELNSLKSYEDMHDRFTSPIMSYMHTLSTQMMNVQKYIGKLTDQHDFQEEGSASIYRFRKTSLDDKKPTEHLPYAAAEVDQITSKLYTAIDTLEGRLEKRCDDIYFPFYVKLNGLDSQVEWLQKEVKAI